MPEARYALREVARRFVAADAGGQEALYRLLCEGQLRAEIKAPSYVLHWTPVSPSFWTDMVDSDDLAGLFPSPRRRDEIQKFTINAKSAFVREKKNLESISLAIAERSFEHLTDDARALLERHELLKDAAKMSAEEWEHLIEQYGDWRATFREEQREEFEPYIVGGSNTDLLFVSEGKKPVSKGLQGRPQKDYWETVYAVGIQLILKGEDAKNPNAFSTKILKALLKIDRNESKWPGQRTIGHRLNDLKNNEIKQRNI